MEGFDFFGESFDLIADIRPLDFGVVFCGFAAVAKRGSPVSGVESLEECFEALGFGEGEDFCLDRDVGDLDGGFDFAEGLGDGF